MLLKAGQLQLPSSYPLAGALIVDDDESLWIAEPYQTEPVGALASSSTKSLLVWEKFSAQGALLERISVPRSITLVVIQQGVFWGTMEDEDGIPLVVRLKPR